MADQSEAKAGQRRRSNQEPQSFPFSRSRFTKWWRWPESSYPYQSRRSLATPDDKTQPITSMLAHGAGISNRTPQQASKDGNVPTGEDRVLLLNGPASSAQTERYTMSKPSQPGDVRPVSHHKESHRVMVTTEGLCLLLYQSRHSAGIWDIPDEILTPENEVHPIYGPVFAPLADPARLGWQRMFEAYVDILGVEISAFRLPEQLQHFVSEEGFALPTYLSSCSPEEEQLRIADELEEIANVPRLQCLGGTRKHALSELMWLRDHERRLLTQLGHVSFELGDSDEIGCLDIDHLSLTGQRTGLRPLKALHDICELDENTTRNAKIRLDLYNKQWRKIHAQSGEASNESSLSEPQAIPWPRKSPVLEGTFDVEHHPDNAKTETLVWKWATHEFFVEAFGLYPISRLDENNEVIFDFTSDDGQMETVAQLKGLRDQMKLEKVRWHEDKMKALFGPVAATGERVKAIWCIVINLKERIDELLAALGS